MKNNLIFLSLILFSASLLSNCALKEPVAVPRPSNEYSIIDGDTIKTLINKDYLKAQSLDPVNINYIVVGDTIVIYQEPKLHTQPANAPDLVKLKNNDDPELKGKPLRYVAVGGSMAAGVRDGGYFNEAIMTSYPNLIARQMRLAKFEQPLFDSDSYNGFGRKAITGFNPTGGPVPKFNIVKNNTAVEDASGVKVRLKPAQNRDRLDNYATPFINEATLMAGIETFKSDRKEISTFFNSIYAKRLVADEKSFVNLAHQINATKYDFLTIDIWTDTIIYGAINGSRGNEFIDYLNGTSYTDKVIASLVDNKKSKLVLVNIPNILDFPYFRIMTKELIMQAIPGEKYIYYYRVNQVPYYEYISESTHTYLPTSTLDSLASTKINLTMKNGGTAKKPMNGNRQIISSGTREDIGNGINRFNIEIEKNSKIYDCALVDLNKFYKIIMGRGYMEDGILIDPSYPNGNFFSSDGLFPTPLGQAIIANEVIRTINRHYKTNIPLISVREYLNR